VDETSTFWRFDLDRVRRMNGVHRAPVAGLRRPDESGVRALEATDMIRPLRETIEGLVTPWRD